MAVRLLKGAGAESVRRLSSEDIKLIVEALDLPQRLRQKLNDSEGSGLMIEDHEAEELRDLCGERLQTHGFDQGYEPTEEGRRLESLIDRLYTGSDSHSSRIRFMGPFQ